jgi:hypothetical protein
MQSSSSPFLVNIVPLQNVVTNASGEDAVTQLQGQVTNIASMIDYATKTVRTDILGAYTAGNSIQVVSPINLSNVVLYQNGTEFSSSGSGSGSNLVNGGSSIVLNNTTLPSNVAISFGVGNAQAGGFRGDSSFFVNGSGSFNGICYATQFVTLSDLRKKGAVEEVKESVVDKLNRINVYTYEYTDSPGDRNMGLLAQEVEAEFPFCVKEKDGKKYVNYEGLVAVLLKAVKELSQKNS